MLSDPSREHVAARGLHLDVRVRRAHQPCLHFESGRGDLADEPFEIKEAEFHVDRDPEHLVGVHGGVSVLAEVNGDEEQAVAVMVLWNSLSAVRISSSLVRWMIE